MATELKKTSKVTEDSVFLLVDDVESAFTYTDDQQEDAFAFYRAKVSKSDKGRIPTNKAFYEWHKAGMPKINSDEIRMERIAVSEGAGKPWNELSEESYEEYRKNWELAGKPEPETFLPRNARAKLIGKVLVNGEETEDELIVHIPGKLLDEYREANGITGPSGFETYLGASEKLWKGKIVPHTLRTTNRTIRLQNGKMVTKSQALKSELNAMLEKAIETGDMGMLKVIKQKLAEA